MGLRSNTCKINLFTCTCTKLMLASLALQDIRAADWSEYVAPFWPAVIQSALTWKGLTTLLRRGWKTIRGALVMPLMIKGYNKGLIKFAVITCRKPIRNLSYLELELELD
ncbi:Tocopherol O-methyltransferase, chloroplastic [Dionaea muscipula]